MVTCYTKHLNRLFLCSLLFSVTACVNTKKAIYFRGQGDAVIRSRDYIPETIIESNDILSILVSSLNQDASSAFNLSNTTDVTSTTASGNRNESAGYLVSHEGIIQFPQLGSIHVAGLTKDQLQDTLTRIITDRKLLIAPIVSVRMLNFKVTVLGEVGHPTVIPVPSERISLLEALGLAGDLTINAKRDNVLVIREEPGQKVVKRLNLNSSALFTSPYYYLRSNDVVYVEPNKTKVMNNSNVAMWVSVVLAALSFGIIVIDHQNN
jgi:polysaccharide export outer membrane protein